MFHPSGAEQCAWLLIWACLSNSVYLIIFLCVRRIKPSIFSDSLQLSRVENSEEVNVTCGSSDGNAGAIQLDWKGTKSYFSVVRVFANEAVVLLIEGYPHRVTEFPFNDGDNITVIESHRKAISCIVGGLLMTSDASIECRIFSVS